MVYSRTLLLTLIERAMLINFNQLFAVQADVAIAKVPLLIPNLLWCGRGTRLKGVQIGPVDLVALEGKTVQVREADGGTIVLENWFPSALSDEE
jgi:hypothetical protein